MAIPQELTDPLGASQSKVTIKTVSAELWLGNDTGNTPLRKAHGVRPYPPAA